ncbi:MAG: fused MFS/spermidine synthase [Verrucomicrobiota bacterium]|nr:fused MFS/spermidine synthase [Limisphaera sp.]MDW8382797.1 fused MFS/spermidine synthase [Verrucomicrobiota bacterium]
MVPLQPAAGAVVAAGGGFAILVLEIVGARYLARDFGSSFYVWVSQIGVVMIALALGYYVGGALADRWQRPGLLAWLLWPTGVFVFAIPWLAPPVLEALVNRHPPDEPIAPIWQKLDPALGSAVIFLWPCFVLAMLSPYFIRLTSRHLAHVGRISGLIIAASTVGSIAGVFAAGYLLVDLMALSTIFRWTGVGVFLLGIACWWLDPGATLPEKRSLT